VTEACTWQDGSGLGLKVELQKCVLKVSNHVLSSELNLEEVHLEEARVLRELRRVDALLLFVRSSLRRSRAWCKCCETCWRAS